MSKKKKIVVNSQALKVPVSFKPKHIIPITITQKKVFDSFKSNKNMFLHGFAGTGKTFLSMYLSLNDICNELSDQKRVVIVRSIVPTRDIGFLPGNTKEKSQEYEAPYRSICVELFGRPVYEELKLKNQISFLTTSFLRGTTIDDAIIIVDECSNLTFHELDSIITRVGRNSRIIFCGDYTQSDLKRHEKSRFSDFTRIISKMNCFDFIEFNMKDIVRSGIVKDYIIAKSKYEFPA